MYPSQHPRRTRRTLICAILAAVAALQPVRADVFKDKFQINETEPGRQDHAALAVDADGSFAVVWESEETIGGDLDAFIRIYDGDGNPLTGELEMHDSLAGDQRRPFLDGDLDGRYVATWATGTQFDQGISQRVFDAATGAPLTDEIVVNVDPIPGRTAAAVAAFRSGTHQGKWIVFWPQWVTLDVEVEFLASVYNADGTLFAGPVRVNQADSIAGPGLQGAESCNEGPGGATPCLKIAPDVAVDGSGWATFAWEHWDDNSIIRARRMNFFTSEFEDEDEVNPSGDPETYSRRPVLDWSDSGTGDGYIVFSEFPTSNVDITLGQSYVTKYRGPTGAWATQVFQFPFAGALGIHKPYVRVKIDPTSPIEHVAVGWTQDTDDLFLRLYDPTSGEIGTMQINETTVDDRRRMDFQIIEIGGELQLVCIWESNEFATSSNIFGKIYRF